MLNRYTTGPWRSVNLGKSWRTVRGSNSSAQVESLLTSPEVERFAVSLVVPFQPQVGASGRIRTDTARFGRPACSPLNTTDALNRHSNRGFIALPIMAYVAVGVVIVLMAMGLALKVQTSRLEAVRTEYEEFKAEVKAKGELAEKERIRKEAEYAKSIKSAVAGRADALKRLRDSTSGGRASLSPTAPAGSSLLCFSPTEFDGAIEHYRSRVRQLVTEGDAAQIDARSLLEAWPR